MRGIVKVENKRDIKLTLELTATVGQWEQILEETQDITKFETSRLRQAVVNGIGKATRSYNLLSEHGEKINI